jgi:glycyl-tRNA synthetase
MESIVNLCKSRGFVFQGSEIYGGLANSWDYGPLGVALKNNIKNAWMKKFIQECPLNSAIDSAILMNPKVWEASGHIGGFSDPLIDCKACKRRFRADKLIEESGKMAAGMANDEMFEYMNQHDIKCPECGAGDFTEIRNFDLMFKTFQGVTEGKKDTIFLRPETAQGMFVNFQNVSRTTRKRIPFGIGQIGKSFRNEITPGNFVFRLREFEQMELEFFCEPGTDDHWFRYWRSFCFNFLISIGFFEKNLQMRDHESSELSHYSKGTTDIEFLFPFGWGELWGIANRSDFDLSQHQHFSGKSMEYFDDKTGKKYIPYVIEPSVGLDRLFLALICNSYTVENLEKKDSRTVLKFHPALAPYVACVMPLSKKLSENSLKIRDFLLENFAVSHDDLGSIGRRYRRQDEIGTPFCITYDFESEFDNKVTVRERDTMLQQRLDISNLKSYLQENLNIMLKTP